MPGNYQGGPRPALGTPSRGPWFARTSVLETNALMVFPVTMSSESGLVWNRKS